MVVGSIVAAEAPFASNLRVDETCEIQSRAIAVLVRSQVNVKPEIERLVGEILKENSRYDRELRSLHRDFLVCPVDVSFSDENLEMQHCMSRNISAAGISLISSFEFTKEMVVYMNLHRPCKKKTREQRIVAECRWCKPFGEIHWMSGWQFMRLKNG